MDSITLPIPTINSVRIIAIDFDGTVFDRTTNLPYAGAKEALKQFRRWGYGIPIYSARANTADSVAWMKGWLKEHGIPHDEIINVKPPRLTWLIDDRVIPFRNDWEAIVGAVKKETFPWKR